MSIFLVLAVLILFHRAQPEFETFFDRFYQLSIRTNWDFRYLNYLIYMVSFGLSVSIAGLFLGRYRGRRREDHKNALIFAGLVSLALLLVSLFII